MMVRVGLLAVVGAAGVLAGCGSEDDASTSAPSLRPVTATAGNGAASSPPSTSSAAEEPDAVTELVGFTSPGGNVSCMIDASFVRCDIVERDWMPPQQPAGCEFDYGQGISMSAGEEAQFVCAGDTAHGSGEPLEYGDSVSAGPLRCDSTEAGITCRDDETGHGFTIAREEYRIF